MTIQSVAVKNVSLHYQKQQLCQSIGLDLPKNSITALLGQSGVGKSSLLRFIAGLLKPYHPQIKICEGSVTDNHHCSIQDNIAFMAQNDALYPWLSVAKNICLSDQFSSSNINEPLLNHILAKVGLADYANYYPAQLSGGMRQRCALARTLYQQKPIILMDEPFSALDIITKQACLKLGKELLHDKIVLMVTHDPYDALILTDRIIILSGSPAQLHQLALAELSELEKQQALLAALAGEKTAC